MTALRSLEAQSLKLILSLFIAFQPLLAWSAPWEGPSPVPAVCDADLTRPTIYKTLPEYRHFRTVFRDTTPELAFRHLRDVLGLDLSANDHLAALIAFLDREDSSYADAVSNLKWFSVRYTRNLLSRSLSVSVSRSRKLVLGRGTPKSDAQLMTYLLSLSEKLARMPLEAQDWPRPWRNGLNTLKSPARFVNDSMATLQAGGERLERTYDQLRAIDPTFKSDLFSEAPHPIEFRSIFAGVIALAAPLAAQAWMQHQVTPYWAMATSTLFAYSVFYAPLHGKLVRLNQTIRTRLGTYWFTSNLVRALLVGTTLYTGLMVYRASNSPEADAKGSLEAILIYFAKSTGEDSGPEEASKTDLSGQIAADQAEIAEYKKQLSTDPKNIELQLHLKVSEDDLRGLLEQQKRIKK